MTTLKRVRVGIGAARYLDVDLALDLGDLHPTGHAALMLDLQIQGGTIHSADPIVGFMHRSSEKLFEARDYRQILMLANRHDWLSALHGELGVALTIEDALGLIPPERAVWSRMLLAEITRVSAHLLLLETLCAAVLPWRETFVATHQAATGNRVHPMITRIGGLARPLDEVWLDEAERLLAAFNEAWPQLRTDVEAGADRVQGLAVLSAVDAAAYGASGPVGRASGVHFDLRWRSPYLAYSKLQESQDAHAPVSRGPEMTAGDARARYLQVVDEVTRSVHLSKQALAKVRAMGEGPIDVLLPKVVRVPEGSWYRAIEGPLGMQGYLLVSTAERTPWRLKLRTPSFSHAQALIAALPGTPVDRLADALASMFIVVGDVDR